MDTFSVDMNQIFLNQVLDIVYLKPVDIALLIQLSSTLKANYNICMQDELNAHTSETIASTVGEEVQNVRRKLKRLEDAGVIHRGKVKGLFEYGKVCIINPYLIKFGNTFPNHIVELFNPEPTSI